MKLKIEGESYRPSVPITTVRTLDESLDTASVVIPYTDRAEPFTPFSFAEMDGERWLIGADVPTQVKGLRGKWRHDVTLIEETKRLETLFVSAKVITKHDYRDYAEDAKAPVYELVTTYDPYHSGYDESSINPLSPGIPAIIGTSFVLNSAEEVRGRGEYTEKELSQVSYAIQKIASKPHVAWVESEGNVLTFTNSVTDKLAVNVPNDIVKSTLEAHYMLLQESQLSGNPVYFYEIKYNLQPTLPADRTTNKTVREIVEELIADAEQLRYKDKPRIKLSEEDAAKLEKIEAPEDAFSAGMTLFEALSKVGDWDGVNGIPRLQRDVLTFEGRGGTEVVNIHGRMISDTSAATVEDYCSTLESNAANMIDEDGNPVSDPFDAGYKTVRTEEGAAFIEDGTMSIHTAFPIWKVTELSLGYVGGKIDAFGGDLTPYVYEKTEYDLLSDFMESGFPNSKAFALYYTKGAPNINGLSFVSRDIKSELGWIQYNAIEHILSVKFGKNANLKSSDMVNLPFRVSYIPYISTRIRQHKMNTNGVEAGMAYGQGGNVISARTYGKHLRSRAQMLGLPERTQQYVCGVTDEVPKPGQRVNDTDYIGTVTVEHYPDYKKVQVTLSPNYNRLNRFVDIKKDLRQYEIPMDGSTERNILAEDYVILGAMEGKFECMMTESMKDSTISAIMGSGSNIDINAAVLVTGNNADKTDGVQVILPVVKAPVGNSVLFFTKYKDNYSAGSMSESYYEFGDSRRLQRDVRYTDVYGNARYLHVDLVTKSTMGDVRGYIDAAHTLPLTEGINTGRSIVSTARKPILLNKDARESISLTYQVHYVSNTDIIIGSELAARSPFVANVARSAPAVYVYRSPINPITGEATEPDTKVYTMTRDKLLGVDLFQMPKGVPSHMSWAVKQNGVFLFGANSPMPEQVYINFRDRLKETMGVDDEALREVVYLNYTVINATHTNITDFTDKGETYYDSYKANSGYALPDSITVKQGGVTLSPTKYTWNKLGSKTALLEIPNVDTTTDITVIAVRQSCKVDIEYEFWDEWGNDLIYTQHIRGTYLYGFKFEIPDELEGEYKGEPKKFTRVGGPSVIIVDKDIRASIQFNMNEEPPLRTVEEEYTFWDEFGNQELFVRRSTTLRHDGFEFPVPAEREEEYEGEMRIFKSGKDTYYVTINGNTKISENYYLNAVNVYNVDITLEYWDEYLNSYRFEEKITGMYYEGQEIKIPARVFKAERWYVLSDYDSDVIVTVASNITRTYVYKEESSETFTVNVEFDFYDKDASTFLWSEKNTYQLQAGVPYYVYEYITREIDGEDVRFTNDKSTYSITIDGNKNIYEVYRLVYDIPVYPDEPDEPDIPTPPTPEEPDTPKTYTVTVEYELWDKDGNQLLATESSTDTRAEGYQIHVPSTIYHTINGERREFTSGRSAYTVTVDRDMTVRQSYYLVEPTAYYVDIDLEYWDEYQNDHRFDEKLTGWYYEGETVTIPGVAVREEKDYLLNGTGNDVKITVTANVTGTYIYTERPTQKYDVKFNLTFWNADKTERVLTESFTTTYTAGSTFDVYGTVYRTVEGKEQEFSNGKSDRTVTVDRNMTITENYYAVQHIYNVYIDIEYWDEWGNDLLFTETIEGEYFEGSSIIIPASVTKKWMGENRDFLLAESSTEIVINVDSDIRRSYTYNMKS